MRSRRASQVSDRPKSGVPDPLVGSSNRSTGSTGRPSSPSNVHDSVPEPGISNRCTRIAPSASRDGQTAASTPPTGPSIPLAHVPDTVGTTPDNRLEGAKHAQVDVQLGEQ